MIVRIEEVNPNTVDVTVDRAEWKPRSKMTEAYALSVLRAATLGQEWDARSMREDEDTDTIVVRCMRRR